MQNEPLSPADVRRIREGLGLTQAEAGELLGGGIRAFQKYESGAVNPSATAANLLRLLANDPSALMRLTGLRTTPVEAADLKPFKVSAAHITALSERRFVALIGHLLGAEALSHGIPLADLHVSSRLTVADGGEDGRLQWKGGPERTSFLPSRLCQVQAKAGPVSPAKAATDILTASRELEPTIRDALAGGGTYLMLCNQAYTRPQLKKREDALLAAVKSSGIAVHPGQIAFRDADQIAVWANSHPAVATWILEQTQPGLANLLHSYNHWAGRHEHESVALVADERQSPFTTKLRALIAGPRSVARVLGLSGVGKSRLVLEALGLTAEEEASGTGVNALILYAVESELGTPATKGAVQALVDSGARAIAVIDRCIAETHDDIAAMVKRANSRVSLITIDHELPKAAAIPDHYCVVGAASDAVIEAMFKTLVPDLPLEDLRRLVRFANGYPQLAVLVGESWLSNAPLAAVSSDTLIDRIVLGRRPISAEKLLKAAMLLSVFGSVGVDGPLDAELAAIAPLRPDLSLADLRACIDDLRRRGVAQQRGRLVTIQPRPIAASLSERQWTEWSRDQWDEVLTGSLYPHLRERAARHLTLLNTLKTGHEVTRHICRPAGPLDSLAQITDEEQSLIIPSLAEVNAPAVSSLLQHVIEGEDSDTLRQIDGKVRRHIIWALQKISFRPETFDTGASLLLKFAIAENERFSNNAIGQFKALFPVFNGSTAADGDARLVFLDQRAKGAEHAEYALVIQALLNAIRMEFVSRFVGSESHGLAPALEPWLPRTWNDAWEYVRGCITRLVEAAKGSDPAGQEAAVGLGHQLRSLLRSGLMDAVELAVHQVTASRGPYWPEALQSLNDATQYDSAGFDADTAGRVRALIVALTPDDMASRIRFLITDMPFDYPSDLDLDFDAKEARKEADVRALVQELLRQPELLARQLPQLSNGEQRMALSFGWHLAIEAADPPQWRARVLRAYQSAPAATRNAALLTGYFAGLSLHSPQLVERLKRASLRSADFAPLLPLVCWKMGISGRDIGLVCFALERNIFSPRRLMQWTFGGRLAKLSPQEAAPLFVALLGGSSEGYEVGVELLGMYVFNQSGRLEELRPQLLLVARGLGQHELRRRDLAGHAAKDLIEWLLRKGRGDADACTAALVLARGIVAIARNGNVDSESPMKHLLPVLLREFPEIVWPLIGQAIGAEPKSAWHLQLLLGDTYSFGANPSPPLLQLPEGTLFAWCHAYPGTAPAFVATIVPILTTRNAAENPQLHPVVGRLLDEFGGREDVQKALVRNMHTFGWTGSRTTYFELFRKPLSELTSHKDPAVRRWAARMLEQISAEIHAAEQEEQEQIAHWE
jgi:transcriptional regulator with XRE-family HTH domain